MVREVLIIGLVFTMFITINGSLVKLKKQSENRFNIIENERTKYAKLMATYVDDSVDPCDDFYQYACGNYFKIHKVKHGVGSTGVFDIVADEMNEALHDILMEPVNNDKQSVTDKAKLYYQSCMGVNIFNFPKSDTYLKLIESLGGWPALDPTWNPEKFDWFNVNLELASLGVNAFLMVGLRYDYVVLVDGPFGIHEELVDRPFSKKYLTNKAFVMKISNMYGVPKKTAKKMFKEIIQLGKKWGTFTAAIQLESPNDENSNKTFETLKEEVPEIDWDRFTQKLFGKEIDLSQEVITRSSFLKKLPTFFTKENARAAANYMFLQLLYSLHSEFQHPKYHKDFCITKLKEVMPDVVTIMYLNSKYHQDTVEDEVMSMASYMRSAFKDIIKEADWMDMETKRKALIKLRDMRMVVGDVELTLDLKTLDNEYKDVEASNNFYENNLILLRHYRQKLLNKFIENSLEEELGRYDSAVNAYYSPSGNKMILPAGILRKPFFISGLPNSYNYAAMGANILGHEMTHGFDSTGRNYDENGNEEDWWSEEADAAFQERAKCFVEQYDAYHIPELNTNVRGNLTLPENIADSGGVRQGYFAYEKWLKAHEGLYDESRETLPYLNMTNYQLFFLSYAQSYCSKYNRRMYKILESDVHAADKFRVIGSVSNFDEFGKHFNCKLGTTMNPEKKCVLW